MFKMLQDTRFTAALLGLGLVCATVLVAMGKVEFAEAAKVIGAMVYGASVTWHRGSGNGNGEVE